MKKKTGIIVEAIGSGFFLAIASIIFYVFESRATEIIVGRLLKFVVYFCYILGLNLFYRVKHRGEGIDPDSDEAMKTHIKMTLFTISVLVLMEISLILYPIT